MAAKNELAVLMITHFNKSSTQELIERFIGSIGLIAAARAGYAVIKIDNEKGEDRRYFIPVKNNLGNDRQGFSYETSGVDLGNGIKTSKILWHPEPVDASQILKPQEEKKPTQINAAGEFLSDLLSEAPKLKSDIEQEAEGAGYSMSSLQRAKKRLGVKHHKLGMDKGWVWYFEHHEDAARKM